MLCAAAALATAVSPASAATSAASSGPARVAVVDCFSEPQVRPGDFLIACGDGNNHLIGLQWSDWGDTSAKGSGFDSVNDCQPYCAAGRFHSYPVVVSLDRPQSWEKRPELKHFTRMQLTYTGDRPAHTEQHETYELWD
ncbi:hypothetical protein AB0L71_12420 [Streptomyces sp. NPDC052052]|uniref:hypothetical protein n=1 Tax=Streptomyces sp. NPDC052052 TaxID=3154756 RepID=UPI0034196728